MERRGKPPNATFTLKTGKLSAEVVPRGMTLLEVLVVVALLVVLAALLLPALAQAKGKAHRVDCLSRLKQWGGAFYSFAEDNEGWIARECYEPLGEVTINNWS